MPNDPSEKAPPPTPPEGKAEGVPVPRKPAAEAPAKPAAPAAAPPRPSAPAKEPPPKPVPLDNELVQRLKARFGDAIRESTLDRKQAIVLVARDKLREVSRYCRDDEKFDYLVDLTAVDWPKRAER